MSETTSVKYPKNWNHEAIQKYFTQESQQKSREEFEKTHVPIRRIKVTRNNNVSGFDDEYIDEETFRDGVVSSDLTDDNRLFFVVGESGSGKSELCQWLQYEIDDLADDETEDFDHVPIHIPRQVREPREVLNRLMGYLDDAQLDEAKRLAGLPPKGVFEKTIGTITVAFDKGSAAVDLVSDDSFRSTVRENLEEFVESFDDPRSELEFEPVSEDALEEFLDEYPAVRDEYGQEDATAKEELYDIITREAKEAIKEMLFVGDLKETLRQINERFQEQNERPVLIIEDLTGFTIFQHEILSFFSELSASNWDVIIGVTTGMEQKLVEGRRADIASQDTINDRIAARVTLTEQTENGSKTLFLEQENVHIELAQTYLRAIKDETAVGFDVDPGIPEPELDEVFGEGLYPFNERFLTRIYNNLQEDDRKKQTPRVFLKFVLQGLLDNDNPPFQHAELLDTLGTVRCVISADYQQPDRNLLKWYGVEHTDEEVQRVDPQIPKTFGIDSNGEAPLLTGGDFCPECGSPLRETDSGASVCDRCDTTCDECGAAMKQEEEFWVCTKDNSHQKPIGGRNQLFEERRQEMLDWRAEGAEFNKTSQIEDGAERVIRFFHNNPTSLVRDECRSEDAAAFWWDKGGRRVPIHVDNGDEPSYRKVVLKRELPETLLQDLLFLGTYDESTVEEHIENDSVDAQQLRSWTSEVVEEFKSELEADIQRKFSADIDRVALFGKYLLNIFTGNGAEFSAEALAQPVDMDDFSRGAKPSALEFTMSKLDEHGEALLGLFHARFHLRSNMVDYERLESYVEATSPAELCSEVRNMSRGSGGFKIGQTRRAAIDLQEFLVLPAHFGLRTIARSIREYNQDDNYRTDLSELQWTFDELHEYYEPIDTPDEIELAAVDQAYEVLPGTFAPEVITNLQDLDSEMLSKYEQALEELDDIADQLSEVQSVWDFLSVYYRVTTFKYSDWKDQYNNLDDLEDELQSLDRNLKTRTKKLKSELEVNIDTKPFEDAQNSANTLLQKLEDEG